MKLFSAAFTENDYSVSIMTVGSGTTGEVGDVISLSTGSDFTLVVLQQVRHWQSI
jgi:hypothetical protein